MRVTWPAGQVQVPAARSIWKSSLGKWVRSGHLRTLAIRGPSGRGIYGDGGLVAVKTLAPALAPVAHLGVMYGYDAVPAHPLFEAYARRRPGHILVQQLA